MFVTHPSKTQVINVFEVLAIIWLPLKLQVSNIDTIVAKSKKNQKCDQIPSDCSFHNHSFIVAKLPQIVLTEMMICPAEVHINPQN